jgi:hypothetical protein
LMRANGLNDGIRNNYEGKLLAVCQKYDFKINSLRASQHLHQQNLQSKKCTLTILS